MGDLNFGIEGEKEEIKNYIQILEFTNDKIMIETIMQVLRSSDTLQTNKQKYRSLEDYVEP